MTAKMLLEQYMLNAMRLGLCQKPTKDAFGVSCVITKEPEDGKIVFSKEYVLEHIGTGLKPKGKHCTPRCQRNKWIS